MTGPQAPIGENLTNGIKLAEEDLKAKGIDVQLVWEDDTGKPQVGLSAVEKLATRDNVAGIVGAYTSAVTNAVAKKAEQYKVPLVNPVASKEEITRQNYKWVFRVSATTGDYAADPARHGDSRSASRRASPSSTRTPTSASRRPRAPRQLRREAGASRWSSRRPTRPARPTTAPRSPR